MSETVQRWRGLTALVADMVLQGASAVERIHLSTARKPFTVLKHIPGVAPGAALVETIYNGSVAGTYASVRAVTRIVAKTVDVALEAADEHDASRVTHTTPAQPSPDQQSPRRDSGLCS